MNDYWKIKKYSIVNVKLYIKRQIVYCAELHCIQGWVLSNILQYYSAIWREI